MKPRKTQYDTAAIRRRISHGFESRSDSNHQETKHPRTAMPATIRTRIFPG